MFCFSALTRDQDQDHIVFVFTVYLIIMANYKCYVRCFVPSCDSSSVKTPNKQFFNVPRGEPRKLWCKKVGAKDLSLQSPARCCEDHFNLETDTENWIRKSLNPDTRLRLKPSALPRTEPQPLDSGEPHEFHEPLLILDTDVDMLLVDPPTHHEMEDPNLQGTFAKPLNPGLPSEPDESVATRDSTSCPLCGCQGACKKEIIDSDCQAQVETSAKIATGSRPQKRPRIEEDFIPLSQISEISSHSSGVGTQVNTSESSQEFRKPYEQMQRQNINMLAMESRPMLYLGLHVGTIKFVAILVKFTKLSKVDIFIVLRKVRKNEAIDELVDIFGMDRMAISRAIDNGIPIVAAYLRCFIFWPAEEVIKANLPIPFRARYSKVQSIIDCFEVEIEKPSNALHQVLTFSNYKGTNTLKFLVSSTPDGHRNFVSTGFCGRTSDQQIVEHSGFLDHLPPNSLVMADRGFKNIDALLLEKNCTLVRPPSVSAKSTLSKEEARLAKRVAGLRIHIERVIQRIREYEFLAPHSCFHHGLMSQIDNVVIISCALSNMQKRLIN